MNLISWLSGRAMGGRRVRRPVILLAWELGAGWGHVTRLQAVAERIMVEYEGHLSLWFALRTPDANAAIAKRFPSARVIAAPVCRGKSFRGGINYSDVLSKCGYHDADLLGNLVAAWQRIFDVCRPDLIICDHSPTVVLAAAHSIPVVHIGSGFATPPVGVPFLRLRHGSLAEAKQREQIVLRSIQSVQSCCGRPAISGVSELLGLGKNIPCCFPELDPYAHVRAVAAQGPVARLPAYVSPPSEATGTLFGYLAGRDVRTLEIVRQLAEAGVRAWIYIRGMDPIYKTILRGSSVQLYLNPVDLVESLKGMSGILHHGGLSTTEVALAMGRPQFLLPSNIEQSLTVDAIERLGCGENIARRIGAVGDRVRECLAQKTYSERAKAVAITIESRPGDVTISSIASYCMGVLRGTPSCSARGRPEDRRPEDVMS